MSWPPAAAGSRPPAALRPARLRDQLWARPQCGFGGRGDLWFLQGQSTLGWVSIQLSVRPAALTWAWAWPCPRSFLYLKR